MEKLDGNGELENKGEIAGKGELENKGELASKGVFPTSLHWISNNRTPGAQGSAISPPRAAAGRPSQPAPQPLRVNRRETKPGKLGGIVGIII